MCPHGYHHNGFMETPALGTREDIIYVWLKLYEATFSTYLHLFFKYQVLKDTKIDPQNQ